MDQVTKDWGWEHHFSSRNIFQVAPSRRTTHSWRALIEESALGKALEASDPLQVCVSETKVVLNQPMSKGKQI